MGKRSVLKNYGFLGVMLLSMLLRCVLGWIAPGAAVAVKPLGTVFINMMFCVVVPLVFASVAGSVASMGNMRRAGRIMGITVTVFMATGAIAAIIMFALMKAVPPVLAPWQEIPAGEMGEYASLPDLLVNFFTVGDFAGLLSRKAMLPLIVFSVLFGFAANMAGGPETAVAGRHAAAHHQACCGVPGHLLVGDHYPYQTDEIVRDEDMAVFVTVMG